MMFIDPWGGNWVTAAEQNRTEKEIQSSAAADTEHPEEKTQGWKVTEDFNSSTL